MNQAQLNLLHHPNIQMLLTEFGFEIQTPHDPQIPNIQRRIEQWFSEFENPVTTSPFRTQEDITHFITTNRQQFGNAWCPF